jgi:hypothetical protein
MTDEQILKGIKNIEKTLSKILSLPVIDHVEPHINSIACDLEILKLIIGRRKDNILMEEGQAYPEEIENFLATLKPTENGVNTPPRKGQKRFNSGE